MKKVFFFFSIVLALFHPTKSQALEVVHGRSLEIVHQKLFLLSNNSKSENTYFDVDLLEEDNDDVNTLSRKSFSSEKTAFIIPSLSAYNFSGNGFKTALPANYFLHFPSSNFISLRVFRL